MRTVVLNLAVCAVAMFGLTACSGSDDSVDYAAWEAELAEANGYATPNFQKVRELAEEACDQSESDFALYVALGLDMGSENAVRTGVSYACPERTGEINEVLNNSADIDKICREGVDSQKVAPRPCRLLGVTDPP